MALESADRIWDRMARYLTGEVALRQLQEWIDPVDWAVEASGDEVAIDLSHGLSLLLAEFSSGQLPEEQLRGEIRGLVALRYMRVVQGPESVSRTSSASRTREVRTGYPAVMSATFKRLREPGPEEDQHAGTRHVVGCA